MRWRAILLPLAATLLATHARADYTPAINLSNTGTYSWPTITELDVGGRLFVGWEEQGGAQLLLVRSNDSGATFTAPRALLPQQEFVSYGQAQLVTDPLSARLHASATRFDTAGGGAEIVYTRSADSGDTFTVPLVVSTIDAVNSYSSSVAAGWAIAVAWSDANLTTGATRIFFTRSLDGGGSFSPPHPLTNVEPGSHNCPDVALADPSTVFVAWVQGPNLDQDIFFTRSVDGGNSFSPPANVSSLTTRSGCPRLTVGGDGTIYVVWGEGDAWTDMRVMFARSSDGGQSFSAPRQLTATTDRALVVTRVSLVGTTLYVGWGTLEPGGRRECFAMRSADGGDTFSAPLTLPGGGQFAPGPDSVLHVSWPQVPASGQYPDVFYSRGDAIAFPAFADVPSTYWAWRWIEALFRARVSGGCGALPPRYCPELPVLRGDMAVFLLRSKEGSQYVPPPATGVFEDIPTSSPIAPWVEELHRRRITGGCGVAPLRYCPGDPVLRSHMAVFLLRTLLGGDYTPPPATGMFQDVAPTDPFAPWIEELARRGVTSGCSASPPLYCPGSPATRAEMAVFLVSTFAIPL